MGCGTSQVKKTERSNSQVTIESQQRTVAAYRRQHIARDMEQIASLRAEAEVEKALMLKRSSLGSVDERRPSYVMRVLEDLAEVEEGQEEVEEANPDPVILNGTYHNGKELEQSRNERNVALHSSVTQQHSVTLEKDLEDDLHLNKSAYNDELLEDHDQNDEGIALHTSVTQDNCVTQDEKREDSLKLATHAQSEDETAHAQSQSVEAQNSLTTSGAKEESNLNTDIHIQNDEGPEHEGPGRERDSMLDGTAHAQENTVNADHNLTNHDREEGKTRKDDDMQDKIDVEGEKSKDNPRERETELKETNELESKRLEQNGVQESTDLPNILNQPFHG